MRIPRILLILSFASLVQVAKADAPRPFELGVVPYLPTTKLVMAYQPLRAHLENELKRPVVLSTAPDFITFLERCLRKEYDAIVLGPGLGRFVQLEAGYQPLAVTSRNVKAIIIVERNAPYTRLKDLSGKRVAMLDPMIVLSQLGKETFRQSGMQPDRDYRIRIVKTPSNTAHAVLQGEVEAGVTTANLVPQLAEDMKHRLRVLAESREIPGLMFMLQPTPALRIDQARDILMRFEKTEAGRQFIDTMDMNGLRMPSEREIKSLDVFLPEFRKHFKR
ncbi:MAG: hypothetical protein BroJett006_18920 [Betaproteobacteria bacterium]|nr:MAG: hypothetical protein BroJett006_18920 [Betaproteobacteria bacterium]